MATSDGESVDSSSDVGRTPLPGGHQGSTLQGEASVLTQGSAPLQESSVASTQGSAGVVVSTDNLVWGKSMAVVKYSPHPSKPSTANSSAGVLIPVRPNNTEHVWGGSKGFADQAPRLGKSKCGLCGRGPPEVQMVMREEDADACMGCDDAVVTCFPRQTWRKMVALAGADDDFRQVILKAAQVRAGKASRPEMPEAVGVDVRTGCTIEKIYWHLTPDEFVEEFGYTPEQLQVPVEEQTEDEFGEQTPGVIISVGSLPAAGLARGRLVRVFHSRCSYLDLKTMPESLHCRPNQGLDELVHTRIAHASVVPEWASLAVSLGTVLDRQKKVGQGEVVQGGVVGAPKRKSGVVVSALASKILRGTATFMSSAVTSAIAQIKAPAQGKVGCPTQIFSQSGPAKFKQKRPQLQAGASAQCKRRRRGEVAEAAEGNELDVNVKKLPLTRILLGEFPKVGNVIAGVERIATGCMKNSEKKEDGKALRSHAKLASAAAACQLKDIPTITMAELSTNLLTLRTKQDLEWPLAVQLALVRRFAREDKDMADQLARLWPSATVSKQGAFNPVKPRMCDIIGDDREIRQLFEKSVLEDIVLAALEDEEGNAHENPDDIDIKLLARARKCFWSCWSQASETEKKLTVTAGQCLDAILFLLDSVQGTAHDTDGSPHGAETSWRDARRMWEVAADKTPLGNLGSIMSAGFWKTSQKEIMARMVPTARLAPVLATHTSKLTSGTATLMEVQHWVDSLPSWRQQVRAGVTNDVEAALASFVEKLVGGMAVGSMQGPPLTTVEARHISQVLVSMSALDPPVLAPALTQGLHKIVEEQLANCQALEDCSEIEKCAELCIADFNEHHRDVLERLAPLACKIPLSTYSKVMQAIVAAENFVALAVSPEEGGHTWLQQVISVAKLFGGFLVNAIIRLFGQ